jgi:hypothetical protein
MYVAVFKWHALAFSSICAHSSAEYTISLRRSVLFFLAIFIRPFFFAFLFIGSLFPSLRLGLQSL